MKKKIVMLVAVLMLITTAVSASSLNGDYKGNPIVKITSNGIPLELDEVPPMILDGHTVVPISLLRQLGASVTWDPETYGVDVKLPKSQPNPSSDMQNIVDAMNNVASENNGSDFTISYDKNGSYSSIHLTSSMNADKDETNMYILLSLSANAINVKEHYVKLFVADSNNLSFVTNHADALDYLNKKISFTEFKNKVRLIDMGNMQQPPSPSVSNNTNQCSDILSQYAIDRNDVITSENQRGGTYSGGLEYRLQILKDGRDKQLKAVGCAIPLE